MKSKRTCNVCNKLKKKVYKIGKFWVCENCDKEEKFSIEIYTGKVENIKKGV